MFTMCLGLGRFNLFSSTAVADKRYTVTYSATTVELEDSRKEIALVGDYHRSEKAFVLRLICKKSLYAMISMTTKEHREQQSRQDVDRDKRAAEEAADAQVDAAARMAIRGIKSASAKRRRPRRRQPVSQTADARESQTKAPQEGKTKRYSKNGRASQAGRPHPSSKRQDVSQDMPADRDRNSAGEADGAPTDSSEEAHAACHERAKKLRNEHEAEEMTQTSKTVLGDNILRWHAEVSRGPGTQHAHQGTDMEAAAQLRGSLEKSTKKALVVDVKKRSVGSQTDQEMQLLSGSTDASEAAEMTATQAPQVSSKDKLQEDQETAAVATAANVMRKALSADGARTGVTVAAAAHFLLLMTGTISVAWLTESRISHHRQTAPDGQEIGTWSGAARTQTGMGPNQDSGMTGRSDKNKIEDCDARRWQVTVGAEAIGTQQRLQEQHWPDKGQRAVDSEKKDVMTGAGWQGKQASEIHASWTGKRTAGTLALGSLAKRRARRRTASRHASARGTRQQGSRRSSASSSRRGMRKARTRAQAQGKRQARQDSCR